MIRERLRDTFGADHTGIRIQYGGSVKPDNVVELMAQEDIDGALVGRRQPRARELRRDRQLPGGLGVTLFVTVLHVVVCLVLIVVVLLQRGKGAEVGAMFGGGGAGTMFGSRGAGELPHPPHLGRRRGVHGHEPHPRLRRPGQEQRHPLRRRGGPGREPVRRARGRARGGVRLRRAGVPPSRRSRPSPPRHRTRAQVRPPSRRPRRASRGSRPRSRRSRRPRAARRRRRIEPRPYHAPVARSPLPRKRAVAPRGARAGYPGPDPSVMLRPPDSRAAVAELVDAPA